MFTDTIAAIATAPGVGGVAIIRISGEHALKIADAVFLSKTPPSKAAPYFMQYGSVISGGRLIDRAFCVVMHAPHSFTGENVAEIHTHGGIHVTETVLKLILENGARLAAPGEFTRRAFLNGKMDLAQSEALGDLIYSNTDLSLYSAANQLEGVLSEKINDIRNKIIDITAQICVAADYPEEDIDYIKAEEFAATLREIKRELDELIATSETGRIIREGVRCAIIGRPNTGKSSLLNALVGERRAIVTDIAGTTRDIIEEIININGIAVKLGDTAGFRKGQGKVEEIGIEMARHYIDKADICILVRDSSASDNDEEIFELVKGKKLIVTMNKCDLARKEGGINTSTVTGEGIDELKRAIYKLAVGSEITFAQKARITNIRHRDAAIKAVQSIDFALETIKKGFPPDLVAVDLENSAAFLGEITGLTVSDEIVDKIFSKFCLGK